MRIAELLREDAVLPQLRASDPNDAIRELGTFLSQRYPTISKEDAIHVLLEREALGSTAVDDGLAIPHAKLASVDRLVACFGRSRKGIDFGAPDGNPSHYFFVLIAPEVAAGAHLKTLAHVSRLFRDASFRTRLLTARDAHEMYEVMIAEDEV